MVHLRIIHATCKVNLWRQKEQNCWKKSRTQIVKDKKAEILMMHDMRNNLIQIDFWGDKKNVEK